MKNNDIYVDLEYEKEIARKSLIEKQSYKQMLNILTQQTNSIVWEVDSKLNISSVIGPIKDISEYDSEELIGFPINKLLSQKSANALIEHIKIKTTETINLTIQTKTNILTSIQTTFIASKKKDKLWKIFCVSVVRQREKPSLYEEIIKNLNHGIIVMDLDKVIYSNDIINKTFNKKLTCITDILEKIVPEQRGNAINDFIEIKKGGVLSRKKYRLEHIGLISATMSRLDDGKVVFLTNRLATTKKEKING